MEILKHKDTIEELVSSGDEIMKTCTEEEKQIMKVIRHYLHLFGNECEYLNTDPIFKACEAIVTHMHQLVLIFYDLGGPQR